MKHIFIKKTVMVILALLIVVSICSCEDKLTVSNDSSTVSVEETSSQETTSKESTVSFDETTSDVSEETSSVEIEEPFSEETSLIEETSSEETSSTEIKETSSEENSSVTSEETSSKEVVTAKVCEHEYIRAHSPWDYVEGRSWDGRGWAPEKDGILYPTCTEQGMLVEVCSKCKDVQLSNFVDPLGHECEWRIDILPTPTRKGVLVYECTRCYKDMKTESLPKREGDYSKIDSRMSIKEDVRDVVFEYAHLYIIDNRSWGEPPEITVIADDHAYIVYYKENGEKVIIDETMKPGGYATLMIRIKEDGTYTVGNILPLSDENHNGGGC